MNCLDIPTVYFRFYKKRVLEHVKEMEILSDVIESNLIIL